MEGFPTLNKYVHISLSLIRNYFSPPYSEGKPSFQRRHNFYDKFIAVN